MSLRSSEQVFIYYHEAPGVASPSRVCRLAACPLTARPPEAAETIKGSLHRARRAAPIACHRPAAIRLDGQVVWGRMATSLETEPGSAWPTVHASCRAPAVPGPVAPAASALYYDVAAAGAAVVAGSMAPLRNRLTLET